VGANCTQCSERCNNLLVERGGRVGGDGRDGERVDETDRSHQLLHPSQLALVLRVGELDNEARRRALLTPSQSYRDIIESRFDYLPATYDPPTVKLKYLHPFIGLFQTQVV